jgi:hypothetical protein
VKFWKKKEKEKKMNDSMADSLENCINDIIQGERSIEACLDNYPEHYEELERLIPLAIRFRDVPKAVPSPSYVSAARKRIQQRISAKRSEITIQRIYEFIQKGKTYFIRRPQMSIILLISILISMISGGTVYASGNALPGDILYNVKMGVEELRLTLSPEEKDFDLHRQFADERVREILTLIEDGRPNEIPASILGYEKNVEKATEVLKVVKPGRSDWIEVQSVILVEDLAKHHEILTGLLDVVPEQATAAIERAIQASSRGQTPQELPVPEELPVTPPVELPSVPPVSPGNPVEVPPNQEPIDPPVQVPPVDAPPVEAPPVPPAEEPSFPPPSGVDTPPVTPPGGKP